MVVKIKTKARQQSKEGHLNPKHWSSIHELYRACLNNAIDLSEEAELLYQHEHYARAVALSIIAMEEIGKSQIVADFFNSMVSSLELESAFIKHEIKSAYNFREFVLVKKISPFEKEVARSDGGFMFYLPYNKNLKEFSRQLRNHSTLSEVLLWNELKQGKMKGFQFNRQKPLGCYIVDFYCKNLKLVIEIDGCSHDNDEAYLNDIERQKIWVAYPFSGSVMLLKQAQLLYIHPNDTCLTN